MQVSVEKIDSVKRRLTITVPVEVVNSEYQKQITNLSKSVTIKGFRPGKAPASIITKRFGNEARIDALNNVINNSLSKALAEQGLNPIGTPQVEPTSIDPEKPFEYKVLVEVLPEIENIAFKIDSVEHLLVDVKPEDVEQVITQLQRQYTDWKLVERAAQENDRVVLDYTAYNEGAEPTDGTKHENVPLEIGSGTMLPGFEEGVTGMVVNETKTLHLTYPTDYPDAEKAGKPFNVLVHVKQVFEGKIVALDEQFIKNLGIKSGKLEDFQTQIRQSLELEKTRMVKDHLKGQVFKCLLEQNKLEIPSALIKDEVKKIHDEFYPQHQHQKEHAHAKEEVEAFNTMAVSRLTLSLLLHAFIKQNNIQLDQDAFSSRVEEIASVYENPEAVKTWLLSEQQRPNIELQVLEEQVLKKLIEGVPATEKRIDYSELKGLDQRESA